MSVDILPHLGGKIHRLVDKAMDFDVLWHSSRVLPHSAPLGADFDDHWSGGWDEVFPTGERSANVHGELLPHMGELWSTPAGCEIIENNVGRVEILLTQSTPLTPARWERRISLETGSPSLKIKYTLRNTGFRTFDFNWGLHPALPVAAATRFDIPAQGGEVADSNGGLLGGTGDRYQWPWLGPRDLRKALEADGTTYALHYLTKLLDGWVATTNTARKSGFGLVFDREVFNSVWLWLTYGGWRDYQHAIVEPWTGYPSNLAEARQAGRSRNILPGGELETEVAAVLYHGVESVSQLKSDGSVEAR